MDVMSSRVRMLALYGIPGAAIYVTRNQAQRVLFGPLRPVRPA